MFHATSQLIFTCPCALRLAILVEEIVASETMLCSSVLLNVNDAIERASLLNTIVFDKTGTLMLPELDVVDDRHHARRALDLADRLTFASH